MEVYHLKEVDHFYGDKQALAIDDIAIRSGAITGLIGPNGSGKSTLLKLLGFLEEPTYGTVLFKGKKVDPFSPAVRFKVTLLPQEPYLMHRSVFDNVAYGLKIRGDAGNLKGRVGDALQQVGLEPDKFARRRWTALSGGEAQRVALAARLILRPEVLLLDEPTAGVDTDSARLIRQASLRARDEWSTTLVVATHDWQWLYETCDTVLHLLHGRLFKGGLGCAVYGPWRLGQKGLLQKELADGQVLNAPKPEAEKKIAVLDPARVVISLPDKEPLFRWNLNTLNGSVTRLFLEGNGETVQAAIKVAELVITIRLARDKVESLHLSPGRKVIIAYNPEEIEWF